MLLQLTGVSVGMTIHAMMRSPLDVVRAAASPLRGKAILDVGCGEGGFAALLANEGGDVVGLDPNPDAVARARAAVPAARFDQGVAETLPYDSRSFDAVIFVNALHHVPIPVMADALREAARVLRHDGALVVIEPLPSGTSSKRCACPRTRRSSAWRRRTPSHKRSRPDT